MSELIVDVKSFQKIFGLCGLKCHIVEIWRDVTLEDGRTTDEQRTNNGRNVKIGLEFWKQNSQFRFSTVRIVMSVSNVTSLQNCLCLVKIMRKK